MPFREKFYWGRPSATSLQPNFTFRDVPQQIKSLIWIVTSLPLKSLTTWSKSFYRLISQSIMSKQSRWNAELSKEWNKLRDEDRHWMGLSFSNKQWISFKFRISILTNRSAFDLEILIPCKALWRDSKVCVSMRECQTKRNGFFRGSNLF